ncbi:hypothetical protein [Collimonas silvisoli]
MCSIGHTWEAIPDSITQGRWCPLCALLPIVRAISPGVYSRHCE